MKVSNSNLKFLYKVIYFSLLGIVVGVSSLTLLSVLGIPKSAQIFVVETGSMEPTIPTGSIVFVSEKESYNVGDIITYKSDLGKDLQKKVNVTHRVTSVANENGDMYYETRGDANDGPDPWRANGLNVLGSVNTHLPYLGYIVGFAKTKLGFVTLILTPAIVIILIELKNIFSAIKPKRMEYENNMPARKLYFKL